MATTNKIQTRIALRNDQLSAWESSGVKLLNGEIALARLSGELSDQYEIRIGANGKTWKELSASNLRLPVENVVGLSDYIQNESPKANFYQEDTKAKLDALTDVPHGSIGVVLEKLSADGQDDVEFRTAYWYDTELNGGTWRQMDGNYKADDVYFTDNMQMTYAFGKYKADSTGSFTLECKDKSLAAVLADAYAETKSAAIQKASATWTGPTAITAKEVGEYNTSLSGMSFQFTDGYYKEYNNNLALGVKVSELVMKRTAAKAEDLGDATKNTYNLSAINDTLSATDFGAGTKKTLGAEDRAEISVQFTDSAIDLATYTGTAKYTASTATPKNNVGGSDPDNKTAAGTWTYTFKITQPAGYRKIFFGYRLKTEDPGSYAIADITSDIVRNDIHAKTETSTGASFNFGWLKNSVTLPTKEGDAWKITVKEGTRQIIIAIPRECQKTAKVVHFVSSSAGAMTFDESNTRQSPTNLKVNGAAANTGTEYDVWTWTTTGSIAADSVYSVWFTAS